MTPRVPRQACQIGGWECTNRKGRRRAPRVDAVSASRRGAGLNSGHEKAPPGDREPLSRLKKIKPNQAYPEDSPVALALSEGLQSAETDFRNYLNSQKSAAASGTDRTCADEYLIEPYGIGLRTRSQSRFETI